MPRESRGYNGGLSFHGGQTRQGKTRGEHKPQAPAPVQQPVPGKGYPLPGTKLFSPTPMTPSGGGGTSPNSDIITRGAAVFTDKVTGESVSTEERFARQKEGDKLLSGFKKNAQPYGGANLSDGSGILERGEKNLRDISQTQKEYQDRLDTTGVTNQTRFVPETVMTAKGSFDDGPEGNRFDGWGVVAPPAPQINLGTKEFEKSTPEQVVAFATKHGDKATAPGVNVDAYAARIDQTKPEGAKLVKKYQRAKQGIYDDRK